MEMCPFVLGFGNESFWAGYEDTDSLGRMTYTNWADGEPFVPTTSLSKIELTASADFKWSLARSYRSTFNYVVCREGFPFWNLSMYGC